MNVLVRCPAKVNLHLRVLGRRGDGYHELRTLFAAVGVWDELVVEATRARAVTLTVDPPEAVPAGAENLVVKAATALARRYGVRAGARVQLRKRIPVAGGMGGGSSDAAAALVGLAAAWSLPDSFADLWPLAAGLGADVPFFLLGGAAWGVGTGAEVLPLPDLPPWWVVILPGREPVPTSEVYGRLQAPPLGRPDDDPVYHWVAAGGELPIAACRNDLEAAVGSGWPAVAARLARVRATGPLLARVSGSGGSVFGVFAAEDGAARAAVACAADGAIAAPLLSRAASRLVATGVED